MNSIVRARAWQQFKSNFWMLILANFLYSLIAGFPSAIPLVGWIASLLIFPVLLMGMVNICLNVTYGGKVKIEDLFAYFKDGMFFKPVGVYFLMFTYVFLWGLIPVAGPFIYLVKSYSYGLAPYIWHDNTDISASDAITESRHLMDGHKWELFCCEFPYWLCMLPGTLMYIMSMVPMLLSSIHEDDAGLAIGAFMGMFGVMISYLVMYVSILIVTPLLQVVRANYYFELTRPYREQQSTQTTRDPGRYQSFDQNVGASESEFEKSNAEFTATSDITAAGTEADFAGAAGAGTDFAGTTGTGTDFAGTTGTGTDFAGTTGAATDFAGTTGTGTDFAGATGSAGDFAGATGSSTDFSGTMDDPSGFTSGFDTGTDITSAADPASDITSATDSGADITSTVDTAGDPFKYE